MCNLLQVKLWNSLSGFCFVTFHEHSGSIKGVEFAQNGQVVVSASTDGTVRAFDLYRYVHWSYSPSDGRIGQITAENRQKYSSVFCLV